MKPEDKARQDIDRQLELCGWLVQDHAAVNLSAGPGVAVREFPLSSGFADYLLYAEGKAIATVEAKPVGHSLVGVEEQSKDYSVSLPDGIPAHHTALPFAYESTGAETRFTNRLDPAPASREVFAFHRPDELVRLATLDRQLRAALRGMPGLDAGGLWSAQIEAITNLERSQASARPRALIQMATGSGKTFTACTFCYRLIKFARARRILFLVDRNNLGRQALTEFQRYVSPYTQYKFSEEYTIQRLKRNTIDPAAKVCITTIQRLYSILKGEEEFDEANEEGSLFESESPLAHEPVPVAYNPAVPIEAFDFIVVDECHRSIYNVWRQVLEYFDAFLIGLTATPTAQTLGFFRGNLVQDYSHERAVADGVNVGYDVYRIETEVSSAGAKLKKEPGYFVPHRDRRTRAKRYAELDDDLTYTASQLDRDVVAESQIRLVVRTFRERLFTDIFPGRMEVPKTLVFAKSDLHADDIVRVMREEFGRGNDFCQKITYRTTGKKPEDLLSEFRNSYNPRIAVTVDMIATGTDVKPLECLLFLRNIRSATYFEQMKGRGCRIIPSGDLLHVTPDARCKTRFVIVDAIGVCETDKSHSKPLDRQPTVLFEKLLQMAAQGMAHPDLATTLGARLARLDQAIGPEERDEIREAAGGTGLKALSSGLLDSVDADRNAERAKEEFGLGEYDEPTDAQIDQAEHKAVVSALKPFHDPALRQTLLRIQSNTEQVIDEVTQDTLRRAGYDAGALRKARELLSSFRRFCDEHKDEIEALQILYSRPRRAGLRYRHVRDLARQLGAAPFHVRADQPESVEPLWRAHEAVEPHKVRAHGGKALVDLVALVRHAIDPAEPLTPVEIAVEQRYAEWLAECAQKGLQFTPEQRQWLDAIKNHVAQSLHMDPEDFEYAPFSQMGGMGKACQVFGDRLAGLLAELNERLAA